MESQMRYYYYYKKKNIGGRFHIAYDFNKVILLKTLK